MATCIQTITTGSFEELYPNTSTPFSVNILTNKVFKVVTTATTQAQFRFVFNPTSTVTTVSITVAAYQKVGTSYVDLGAVAFSDLVANFFKDFTVGEFYICVRSNQSYNATVVGVGDFTGFAPTVNFSPVVSDGCTMSVTMENVKPVNACDEPLFYEIVEGSLPPDIFMNDLGRLYGTLPNLDCLVDAVDYSPSQNWSFPDPDGNMHPWGRQWRFKVRVSIAEQPDTSSDEWFCVAVHNNWDFDRDNFVKNAPFKQIRDIVIVDEPVKLPKTVCMVPCVTPIESVFVPQPLVTPECPVCEDVDVVTDITLIKIPELCQKIDVSAIPLWWKNNKDATFSCKETQKFIENLRTSKYFQALLVQIGYNSGTVDPDSVIEATAFKNFLQLTASTLIDGRREHHIDAKMLQWKNRQNQRLPTTGIAYDGAGMELTME